MDMKTGWKTSEFWVTVAASMIPLLNSAMGWNIPIESLAAFAGTIASYVLSRGVAKKA